MFQANFTCIILENLNTRCTLRTWSLPLASNLCLQTATIHLSRINVNDANGGSFGIQAFWFISVKWDFLPFKASWFSEGTYFAQVLRNGVNTLDNNCCVLWEMSLIYLTREQIESVIWHVMESRLNINFDMFAFLQDTHYIYLCFDLAWTYLLFFCLWVHVCRKLSLWMSSYSREIKKNCRKVFTTMDCWRQSLGCQWQIWRRLKPRRYPPLSMPLPTRSSSSRKRLRLARRKLVHLSYMDPSNFL